MKQQIHLLAAALIMMQGCSFEEMEVKPDSPHDAPHKVQIYSEINQQPATRVTIDGFCTGDEVGVYIVNYDGDTPGTLRLEDNQADNVRFSYNENGDWVSDYDVFYKDNETKVDFYGYYPYTDPSSIEAYPFEVARDQSKLAENGQMAAYEASDFLWAKTSKVSPTDSKVILSFYHRMSSARVRFSQGTGWADAAEYASVSKEVLVTNTIRKSTIDLSTGIVTPEGEAPLTGIVPMNDNGEFRAIVVPQTIPAGKTLLTITIDGAPRHFAVEADTEYLPGKITTFDLSIKKMPQTGEHEVELTGVSITAWEADNVSHGDDAKEYVVIHNAVSGGLEKTIVDRMEMDPAKIKNLKLTGCIGYADYSFMRTRMPVLQRLNLKEVESVIDGIYQIPSGAFQNITTLIKCMLPDRLDKIGNSAFAGTALTGTLILPEGLRQVSGFNGTKITTIHFPSTLEEIGENAFNNCKSLMCEISFPEFVRTIGNGAFQSSAIKGNLVLPHNLEKIGSSAFASCSNLTGSLTIPDRVTEIPSNAFSSCGLSGTLTLPDGLAIIGSSAFSSIGFKGELHIPDGVMTIGDNAFAGTLFNGTLVLPSELISLGSSAFQNCWRLSGIVEIPENIVSVPSGLFYGCTGIEGVRLHKDVEVIESQAFYNCSGIYSLVCEAKNPPTINSNSFNGVAKDNFTVEVPEASVNLYKNAASWSEFKRFAAHREFSVGRNLFRMLNDEHSKTFVLRAPAGESWSVESKPDWVEVSPASGTGKVDVTVTASALARGSADRSGEIVFLLDGKDYRSTMTVEQYDYEYGDGDLITLQEAGTGNGVNIVIMGDCFDAKDISEGKYLQAIQNAYSYFFDIEPYLTYKDYFNVYGIFGMSPDSGMGTVNTIREARFGSQYTLNEGVSPDFGTAFAAACLAPIGDDVSRTLVIMIENSSDYSGLCYMWGDGSAVAVVPMSTDPAPYDFRGLVHHEAGGHGFGKLADEYIYHNAFISTCICMCCSHIDAVNTFKSYGFYDNISLTGDMKSVPWSHMIYDPQYSNTVDVYEGAFFHSRGVFRSEPTSCMHNNIPYYNAISREAMVKRIKKYAGEEYSFEEFKANDREALPSVVTKGLAWPEDNAEVSTRFDQMPPKFMGEKPSFKKSDF
ncbi:MAG: hypothetical protein E7117_05390 [Bacteroidales bacterium]|nr:hypothetical protein [Bacteroidales bacterium]